MAQITEYENKVEGLRPTETGIDALVQTGRQANRVATELAGVTEQTGMRVARNIGSTIQTITDRVENYLSHKDTSQYNVASSALVASKAKEWNQAISGVKDADGNWIQKPLNPDDPTAVKNFMDGLNDDLEKLKGSMFTERGQEHAESHNASIRNHFQTTTMSDISTLAGIAAQKKAVTTVNNYSNAAVQDPAGVERYAKLAADAIDAEFGNHNGLKGAAGAKAAAHYKETALKQIYQSAAMSAIQKSNNPEATANAFIAQYPDRINGPEALTLARAAKSVNKMNAAYERQTQLLQKQVEAEDGKRYTGEQIARFIKPDGTIDASAKIQVLKDLKAALDPTDREHYRPGVASHAEALFKFATSEGKVVESNPLVKSELQSRLFNPSSPLGPEDIIKATNEGKLSHADAGILEGQRKLIEEHPINTPAMRAVFDGAKAALVIPTNYSDFMQEFLPQYLRAKANGTLKLGDLNFSDPNSLVSKAVAAHQPSNDAKMKYKIMQRLGNGLDNLTVPGDIEASKALPPLSERKVGTVYPTPRGNMKWTGTGWVNP